MKRSDISTVFALLATAKGEAKENMQNQSLPEHEAFFFKKVHETLEGLFTDREFCKAVTMDYWQNRPSKLDIAKREADSMFSEDIARSYEPDEGEDPNWYKEGF